MAEQIIDEGKPITLDGKEYMLRRLNVRDMFSVVKLFGIAVGAGGIDFSGGMRPEDALKMIIAAIPYAEDDVLKLVGSLVGLTANEFGNLGPLAILEMGEALMQEEDMTAFFVKCGELLEKGGNLNRQQRRAAGSREPLIESNPDTDGETQTS